MKLLISVDGLMKIIINTDKLEIEYYVIQNET